MVSDRGLNLAIHLINSHLGDLVSKVCECLLTKGVLSIAQLKQFTKLNEDNVKKCLRVLIQHNCVQAFAEEQQGRFGEGNKHVVQYMALFDNILHRTRFAKFLVIVSEKLGKECEDVLEGLLQHGRLTIEQIIEKAGQVKANSSKEEVSPLSERVREAFIKLVHAHYVERCPEPEPFLALPIEDDLIPKKKGAKATKIMEKLESLEERAIAAAAHMDSKRFSVVTDTGTDVNQDYGGDSSPTIGTKGKRKHDLYEMDGEPRDENCEKEVVWRVNFEEFVRCLRHKACIANVKSRLDDGAAVVCSAILEVTRSAEFKVKTECSGALSLSTIHEEVMNSETGRTMTLDHVRTSLLQLECRPNGEERLYSLDLNKIIELAQIEEVESIILKRYGRDAYRIFRLLSQRYSFHETDWISDRTFVEKKVTAKILYGLWKDEYIHLEKVVAPGFGKYLLLWKVQKETLREHVLKEMYHAALNLNQRLIYETVRGNEILSMPKENLPLSPQKQIEKLKMVVRVLESSMLKLDDAILLFHDF